jgi:hypothetical protein
MATSPVAAAASPAPPLRLVLRDKDSVSLRVHAPGPLTIVSGVSATAEDAGAGTPALIPIKSGFDASSAVSVISTNGTVLAVSDKDGVDLFSLAPGASPSAAPPLRARVAQAGVVAASLSPLGTFLVTWHRKRAEEGASFCSGGGVGEGGGSARVERPWACGIVRNPAGVAGAAAAFSGRTHIRLS